MKLSKNQRIKVVITAVGILGAIVFVAIGLKYIFPPVQNVAHGVTVAYHQHAHLKIFDQTANKYISIPSDVGNSDITNEIGEVVPAPDYADRTLNNFGPPGYAPVHTHNLDGIIHMESVVNRTYTLGDFINIWGTHIFDGRTVVLTDDATGATLESDYRTHILKDGDTLTLTLK